MARKIDAEKGDADRCSGRTVVLGAPADSLATCRGHVDLPLAVTLILRAGARLPLFEKAGDLDAFERVLLQAHARRPIRILAEWRWSRLAHRGTGDKISALLSAWPAPLPRDWVQRVNQVETETELEALRRSVTRNQPFGSAAWQEQTAEKLGMQSTFRRPGRPRKEVE